MTVGIVWFRTDLRVVDHAPLEALAGRCQRLVAVYCVDPREYAPTRWGFPRTSARRAAFVLGSVIALREELRRRGGDLVVRRGRPIDVIPALAREVGATDLAFHAEAASDERADEAAVEAAVGADGVRVHALWGHTLAPIAALPFSVRDLPGHFTAFRQQVERRVRVPAGRPAPTELPAPVRDVAPGDVPSLAELGLEGALDDPRQLTSFVPGTVAGMARMQGYIWDRDLLRIYKQTRNGLLAPDDSSKLSPWLATGALSPRTVFDAILAYEQERVRNESTYWLAFELWWRDYFRFVALQAGRTLFRRSGPRGRDRQWRWDEARFGAWCRGETGYPLVDANMQELAATGYMSNRGRQIVASFLVNDLEIDWRAGAAWFESQLLDYDPCSNWGNWAYAAGVGNDPRPNRYFDLAKQAASYDTDAAYVRHWLPALAPLAPPLAHEPWRQSDVRYHARVAPLRTAERTTGLLPL